MYENEGRAVTRFRGISLMITGEGPTDYGWQDFETKQWHEGSVARLVRSCATRSNLNVSFTFAHKDQVQSQKLGRHLQGLKGKAIPAKRFQMFMRSKKVAAGIFYCDADRDVCKSNTEAHAKERFNKVRQEIIDGTREDSAVGTVVPMVALRMIESWLLSDQKAFETMFGSQNVLKIKSDLPSKPEYIWGRKDDPQSNYPKNLFVRILKSLNSGNEPTRDDYAMVAENTDIDILAQKCPVSFRTFVDDFEKLVVSANR